MDLEQWEMDYNERINKEHNYAVEMAKKWANCLLEMLIYVREKQEETKKQNNEDDENYKKTGM